VLPQHLLERLSVQQTELREQVDDPLHAVPPLPFGHLNAPWRPLMQQQAEGDEFWSFRAPWSLPWGAREQRCGYAIYSPIQRKIFGRDGERRNTNRYQGLCRVRRWGKAPPAAQKHNGSAPCEG